MKTKYDVGETVLVPCMVKSIAIKRNGVAYQVIPQGYKNTTLEIEEYEIHSSLCNEEAKEGETNE